MIPELYDIILAFQVTRCNTSNYSGNTVPHYKIRNKVVIFGNAVIVAIELYHKPKHIPEPNILILKWH